jgi:hypothetical protein
MNDNNNNISYKKYFSVLANNYRGIAPTATLQPVFPISELVIKILAPHISSIIIKSKLISDKNNIKDISSLSSAFATGLGIGTIANSVEITMIKMQDHNLKMLLTEGGTLSGVGPMALKVGTFMSCLFFFAPYLRNVLDNSNHVGGKSI